MTGKVFVLGLDGLSKGILLYGVKNNYLPFMRSIIENNELIITDMKCVPPLTYPSWTSILTGVNPGFHNIFDFFRYEIKNDSTWKPKIIDSTLLRHPRVHEMIYLSKTNYRSFMINLVPSYPLIPVKGQDVLQLDFFTPKIVSYPRSLKEIYDEEIFDLKELKFRRSLGCDILKKTAKLVDIYTRILSKSPNYSYDLVWMQLPVPDTVFHKCPQALKDPSLLKHMYERLDSLIKIIIDNFENFIIVSDHGFKLYHKRLSINKLLYNNGFIVKRSKKLKQPGIVLSGKLYNLLRKKPLNIIAKTLFKTYLRLRMKPSSKTIYIDPGIDYALSKAFIPVDKADAPPRYYIIISQEISQQDIDKIKYSLSYYGIRVFTPEEFFRGPYTKNAPGLIMVFDNNILPIPGTIYDPVIISKPIATHSINGIFCFHSKEKETLNAMREALANINMLTNTFPASLITGLLKIPLSEHFDYKDVIQSTFDFNKTVNYMKKWRIFMKLVKDKLIK